MITEHTAVVIIQTYFCLVYQQCILYNINDVFNEWDIKDKHINVKKEDDDHFNNLFSSSIFDVDNTIKDFDTLSQSLHGPDPVFQTQQDDFSLQGIHHGTTKTHFFFQLIVDHKQYFDPGGPKFQYPINTSIDGVYFNRLFDPGGGPVVQDCSPFINIDNKIFA
eukprot:15359573-Ditylum_brightwellii.AAC.1